jgi:bifunctional UDP-N-acetylglucosamine pyrophosphorylase/glucosamine-1-phosphate N-acetyltransferase
MARQLTALIMAAGHGTRMKSSLPKVLHPICDVPMVHWVIEAARDAGADRVVCVTRHDRVVEELPPGVEAVEQPEGEEGTGSAVLAAREVLAESDRIVVLSGDVPLISSDLLKQQLATHERQQAVATLLTTDQLDPDGYGRVVRGPGGSVEQIVETKSTDGVPQEVLDVDWINVGAYVFEAEALLSALDEVPLEDNGERYLTNVFPILRARGQRIAAHETDDTLSAMGVNDRVDLMAVTRLAQDRILREHARAGVTFLVSSSVAVGKHVQIGEDTTVAAGVTLAGRTRVGRRCTIGPATTIDDSDLGDGVAVPHSFLIGCRVADGVTIGPFAHLRPEADIRANAKVGAFVEVKKSTIHEGAKVPHLSYVGDADIGAKANLGAGTITANYHRGRKMRTSVGEGVHTGVHTALVAPVNVGDGAYTGAGSVITEDVPAGALAVSRPRDSQKNIEGYAKRLDETQESRS